MSEFQSLPVDSAPPPAAPPPVAKKESLLTRPLFMGQSLPWLASGVLVMVSAAWYLFWPASSAPDAGQLAFGQASGLVAEPPAAAGGLNVPGPAGVGDSVPEDVVKMICEGREFEHANREAISRLSDTVRAQSAAMAALQARLDGLASDHAAQANRLTVLEARQVPASVVSTGARPTPHRSALAGMRLESVQDGMAWVSWRGRTWAVQPGDTLGTVTVRAVNAADRSVTTSAGVLR